MSYILTHFFSNKSLLFFPSALTQTKIGGKHVSDAPLPSFVNLPLKGLRVAKKIIALVPAQRNWIQPILVSNEAPFRSNLQKNEKTLVLYGAPYDTKIGCIQSLWAGTKKYKFSMRSPFKVMPITRDEFDDRSAAHHHHRKTDHFFSCPACQLSWMPWSMSYLNNFSHLFWIDEDNWVNQSSIPSQRCILLSAFVNNWWIYFTKT